MTQSRRSSAACPDGRSERSGSSCPHGPGTESDITQPELGRGVGFGPYGVSPRETLSAKDVQRSLGGQDEQRRTSSRPSHTEPLGEPRRLSRKPQPGEDLSEISYVVGAPERERGASVSAGRRELSPSFSETSHAAVEPRQLTDGTPPARASAIQSRDGLEARKGMATLPQQMSGAHLHSGAGAGEQDCAAPRKGSAAVQSQDSFAARKGTATLPLELSGPHLHSGAGAYDQASLSATQSGSGRREVVEQPYAFLSGGGAQTPHGAGAGRASMKPGGADAPRRSAANEPRNARASAKPCGGDQGGEGAVGNNAPPANEEPRASLQQRQSQRARPSSTAGQRGSQAHQGRQDEKEEKGALRGDEAGAPEDDVTGSTKPDTDNASGSSRGSRRSGEAPRPQPQAVVSPPSRRSSAQPREGRGWPEEEAEEEPAACEAACGHRASKRGSRASRLEHKDEETEEEPAAGEAACGHRASKRGSRASRLEHKDEETEDNASRSSRGSRRSGEAPRPQPQAVVSPPSRRSSAQPMEGRGRPEEEAEEEPAAGEAACGHRASKRGSRASRLEHKDEETEAVVAPPSRRSSAQPMEGRGRPEEEAEEPAACEAAYGHRASKRGSRASRLEHKDEETEVQSDTGHWRKLSDYVGTDRRKSAPERLEEETEGQLQEAHAEPTAEEYEERKSIWLDRDVKNQVAGLVWTFGQDPERRGAWLQGLKKSAPLPPDHNLAAGDELLSVNGVSVRGLPRDEIEQVWLTSQPEAERYLHLEFIARHVAFA